MNDARPSFWRRLIPANFRDPVGLARRILRSRDRAAYFAVASTALAAVVTPLDQLLAATVEKTHLRDQAPARPVILVTGAPRSGTTVLSQALIHHLPVAVLQQPDRRVSARTDHRQHALRPAACRSRPARSTASIGRTSGFASENDGLHLWDRWLGPDRYAVPERLDERTAADLRRFFAAYERAFGRPVLNKNNALATGAVAIADALPTARFIFIRRDPVFAVQSILGARETIQGTRAAPYGVTDPARRQRVTSPIEDVCAQVLYHERRMEEERRIIGDERFWVVDYEQFCLEPHAIVVRVAREILGVDVDVDALRAALPPLRNTNRSKLPAAELDEIERTLARLREHGPARELSA